MNDTTLASGGPCWLLCKTGYGTFQNINGCKTCASKVQAGLLQAIIMLKTMFYVSDQFFSFLNRFIIVQ